MDDLLQEKLLQAKDNLKKAFDDIKWRGMSFDLSKTELTFHGAPSPSILIERYKSELDDLIQYIEKMEKDCSDYIVRYYSAAKKKANSIAFHWSSHSQEEEQNPAVKEQVKSAIESIDNYATHKAREIHQDFMENVKSQVNYLQNNGIGRPWGSGIRQRLATAIGLKNEVNSLFGLGLNSVANSKRVHLGDHFIQLIKADPAMSKVLSKVETEIKRDILFRKKDLSTEVETITHARISGNENIQLGGTRTPGDMLEQLKFTLRHPVASLEKHADTWNVAMNSLTWSIRSARVRFNGTYQAVYNIYGFGFVWEMEFSIEDSFDLRPSSGLKIDFNSSGRNKAYNITTSVLGTLYHDILGNTDNLKISAKWNERGQYQGGNFVPWAGLYYR